MNTQDIHSRLRPVIRVFVSSTFSDMKHERDALAAEVYPKLEDLCQKSGFQFQAIDLRWGVSTEAGLDHRTMRICFDELRRAQEISPEPNFLVLLGDRYGWRPLPEAISAREFEALEKAATTKVTNGEDRRGQGLDPLAVLRAWYRCDENALLPEPPKADPDRIPLNYILQPRQNLGEGCDYTRTKDGQDTQDWLDVQQVLWSLINTAFPAEGRWFEGMDWQRHVGKVNDPQHPKRAIPQFARFQASATEQEIWCGALSAANAERHVIACFREIANRGDFIAAEVKDFFDRTDSGEFDHAAAARQTALKEAIRLRLGESEPLRIPFTRLKREGDGILLDAAEADTKAFCDAVLEKFEPIIERQIEEYWNNSKQGSPERATRELKIEQDEHQRFGRERGGKESFVGREAELEAISAYLQSASRQPLVVHGSSGCGKTALMWRAFEEIPEARKPLIRLIGTTPHSSELRGLLTSLCQQLRQRNPREGALPTEIKELRDEFEGHLRAATAEEPLILFLDALDQLSDYDNGRLLNWIPLGQLPPNVKLVVSCLSDRAKDDAAGQPWVELQKRKLPTENIIDLNALSKAEAKALLFNRWLHQACRTVSRNQRKTIEDRLTSPVCRQPIYLKLLFEEAKLWRSYDTSPKFGENVPALLKQLFARLAQPENHGSLLVNRVLGYLAASRHGLAETEMLEILFADPEYKKSLDDASKTNRHELHASATRIPIAIWSRLRFDLAPYLTERAAVGANVLTFYHRQVAEWVREHFAKSSSINWHPHRHLVDYFGNRSDPTDEGSFVEDNRALTELLFHLVSCGEGLRAQSLLGNLRYLDARCVAGSAMLLLEDYRLLDNIDNPSVECFHNFILLHVQSLEKYPKSFFSLVKHNGPALARAQADNLIAQKLWKKPWLRTAKVELPCPPKTNKQQASILPLRNYEFEHSCAFGFASDRMIVFRLKSLGEIALFDLDRMLELAHRISICRLRPLALFPSHDASHLAIAYENGEAEVIKLLWSPAGTLLSHSGAAAFHYLLPEMDLPVMEWNKGELVYQKDEQHVTCMKFESGIPNSHHHRLPRNLRGELTGVVFVELRLIASFRIGTSGAIVCLAPAGVEVIQHQQCSQALHLSHCGGSLVAAAWSGNRICRYDSNRKLHPIDEVTVNNQPIKLAWVSGIVIWCTYAAELHAWHPAKGLSDSTQLTGDIIVGASSRQAANWQMKALADGSLVTITDAGVSQFRVSFETSASIPKIHAVFEPPNGRIFAIQKREDGGWLVDTARNREVRLSTQESMRLNPLCDVDGKHLLITTVGQSGLSVSLKTQDLQHYQNLSLGVNSISGDPNGGFWMADRTGQILHLAEDGRSRIAATIPLREVSGPNILCTKHFLIWSGTCLSHQESGEDMAQAFVFYRLTSAGLALMGKRILNKCEGQVEAFDYSEAQDLLLVALSKSNGITHGFRKGTIYEYLECSDLFLSRPQSLDRVVRLRFTDDGTKVQLLGGDGVFIIMDITDLRIDGALKPATPFTGLTRGPSTAPRSLIVADQTTLYSYALERPQ